MGFRSFLKTLEKSGELTRISKEVSLEYEMAGIIEALGEKPVLFENVKDSSFPVVAGLVSSKEIIARSLNLEKSHLMHTLSSALEREII